MDHDNRPLANKVFGQFCEYKEHEWILVNHQLKRVFWELFVSLDQNGLNHMLFIRPILFLTSNGTLSCTYGQDRPADLIFIYPDLKKLLLSASYSSGLAVLAHEIGHAVLRHAQRKIEGTQAQIEADQYACQMGYREELEAIIQDLIGHTDEGQIRLYSLKQKNRTN